jgi:hypothetical protein
VGTNQPPPSRNSATGARRWCGESL